MDYRLATVGRGPLLNHADEDGKENAQETANDRSENKTQTKNKRKTHNNQLIGHATGGRGQQTSISWLKIVKKPRGYELQRHCDHHTRKRDVTKITLCLNSSWKRHNTYVETKFCNTPEDQQQLKCSLCLFKET